MCVTSLYIMRSLCLHTICYICKCSFCTLQCLCIECKVMHTHIMISKTVLKRATYVIDTLSFFLLKKYRFYILSVFCCSIFVSFICKITEILHFGNEFAFICILLHYFALFCINSCIFCISFSHGVIESIFKI